MALLPFNIVVHDVGHGQAIHVLTPQEVMVIDLGCSAAFSPLLWLWYEQRRTIDRLLISHPHTDHIDEVEKLVDPWLPPVLISPGWLSEQTIREANQGWHAEKVEAYLRLKARYTGPVTSTPFSATIAGRSIEFQTFAARGCSDSQINNHSLVTFIAYAGWGFMFPGDNEPPSWRELLLNEKFRECLSKTQVFLASHHARESGYCGEIFDILKPKLCVVSDRERADTDWTSRYSEKASGWPIFHPVGGADFRRAVTTRRDGRIVFSITDSGNLQVNVSK